MPVKRKPLPPLWELERLFSYNPENGEFRWRTAVTNPLRIGTSATFMGAGGYLFVGVKGSLYAAHRVAFKMIKGFDPGPYIDHIDGNRTNNKFENLREVTHTQNMQNRKMSKKNKSGFKGVTWDKSKCRWRAQIKVGGCFVLLGTFKKAELAADAYKAAATEHFGEYARIK